MNSKYFFVFFLITFYFNVMETSGQMSRDMDGCLLRYKGEFDRITFDQIHEKISFSLFLPTAMGKKIIHTENIKFLVLGKGQKGSVISPIISGPSNIDNYFSSEKGEVHFRPGTVGEINVYFPEPISEIHISSPDPFIQKSLEKQLPAKFLSFDEKEQVANPRLDCAKRILFLLDGSSSMKKEEKMGIQTAVMQGLVEKNSEVEIAMMAFDQEVMLSTEYFSLDEQVDKNQLSMKLKDYAENQVDHTSVTDWSMALQAVGEMEERPDLVYLITDAPPNCAYQKKMSRTQAHYEAVHIANELKASGIRIVGIGAQGVNDHNAPHWFGLLSGNNAGKKGLPSEHGDYYILDDFSELAEVLKQQPFNCADKTSKTEKSVTIFPNPAKNTISILFNQYEIEELSRIGVYNMLGEHIYSNESVEMNMELQITDWPPGTYKVLLYDQDDQIIESNEFVKF